jgi:ribonucleotide monophosphatase NagD (HAD superfamily)
MDLMNQLKAVIFDIDGVLIVGKILETGGI